MPGWIGFKCGIYEYAVRQKPVDGWRKYFRLQRYTAENVRCDGCLNDGKLADINCRVRPCVIDKSIENCAYCDEFPCEKLKAVLCGREELLSRFNDISEEDYNFYMRMFESEPRLLETRKAWVKNNSFANGLPESSARSKGYITRYGRAAMTVHGGTRT